MRFNMYAYVLYSWLFALLLHPFFFMCIGFGGGSFEDDLWDTMTTVVGFFWMGMMYSLPALFVSTILLRVILVIVTKNSLTALLFWYLVICISIVVFPGTLVLSFFSRIDRIVGATGSGILEDIFDLFTPAFAAVAVALLVRSRQFNRMYIQFGRVRRLQSQKKISV